MGLGRDLAEDGVAAPLLGRDALLGELGADLFGVGALFVDLVDGDQHRHVGGAGVVDRLLGLRHDAVVGGDDDDGDVGDLGAAGAHRREGGVAGRVEEGDRLVVVVDLVGADVLGDAAGLAGGDLGLADRVQQRGLAVVDVAHDRDHRRAVDEVLVGVGELRLLGLLLGGGDDLQLAVVLVGDRPDRLVGEGLGQRRHLPHRHQFFDHLGRGQAERLGDLAHGGAGVDLGRLGLDRRRRTHRRLLQQRPAAAATAAARRALRRRAAHLVAAGGLRVDHDAAFFGAAAAAALLGPPAGRTGLVEVAAFGGGRGGFRRRCRRGGGFSRRARRAPAFGAAAVRRLRAGVRAPSPPLPLAAAIAFAASASSTLEAAALASTPAAFSAASSFLAADAMRFRDLVNPLLSH